MHPRSDSFHSLRTLPTGKGPSTPLVPAVSRALALLERLAGTREPMSLARLATDLALPKSSVHGLCNTLVSFGYLRRQPDGAFLIGPRVMGLAEAFVAGTDVAQEFNALWADARQRPEETVVLSVLSRHRRALRRRCATARARSAWPSTSACGCRPICRAAARRCSPAARRPRCGAASPAGLRRAPHAQGPARRRGPAQGARAGAPARLQHRRRRRARRRLFVRRAGVRRLRRRSVAGVAVCINKAQLGATAASATATPRSPSPPTLSQRLGGEARAGAAARERQRAMSAAGSGDLILETREPDEGVQGLRRGQQRRPAGAARHHPRADRPQRRRQDDLLQPADQVPARRPRGTILFDGHDITAEKPARDRAPRRGPLVPDLGGVRAPLGARERARRAAAQARHLVPLLEARSARCTASTRARWSCCAPSISRPTPRSRRSSCSYGRKRALEIATTLAMDPKLMLLDEPTQGMGLEDVDRIRAADQEGRGRPHRADGRAQHERGRQHRRHHHRAAARRDAGRRPVRRGVEEPGGDRGLHGHAPTSARASSSAGSALGRLAH